MRARHRWLWSLLGGALWLASPSPARAVIVERVVAVIGERPILLSELRQRARPFLAQIAAKVPAGAQQAAAESQMLRELLQKLVEEELIQQAAERARVSIADTELDRALENVAGSQGLTVPQLYAEALGRTGLKEKDYREELRRQLLEGKMLQLRMRGRIRITDEDLRGAYEKALREERQRLDYHPGWIVLRVLPGSTAEQVRARQALAEELAQRARGGEDFAALAKAYSDDTATRDKGGDLGLRSPQGAPGGTAPGMAPALEADLLALQPGEVASPRSAGDAWVVLKLLERAPSRLPTFAEAREELAQRIQGELLERSKKRWLDELRQRTHLDVRL